MSANKLAECDIDYDCEFARDVIRGLSLPQKALSSKYFYDDKGSELFDRITDQPEYYLTRAEMSIIDEYGGNFFSEMRDQAFNLIELGCGNGEKTFRLLDAMLAAKQRFHFYPIDISRVAINGLLTQLKRRFPALKVDGKIGDYQRMIKEINRVGEFDRNIVLFLGSNIGNYSKVEANKIISHLHGSMHSGDLLLIGMDLKKDFKRMTDAYNDANGVTEAFNLNLLTRMNSELGAGFSLELFSHYEIYNPLASAMQSFLVAQEDHCVTFSKLDFEVCFEAHETIFVESSHKYSFSDIDTFAKQNGFKVRKNFVDKGGDFVDSLWERI